jgi:adenylate cyclase
MTSSIDHAEPSAAAGLRGLTVARLRQDLADPIQAAVTLAKRLLREAEEDNGPADLIDDIRKMHDGGEKLLELVRAGSETIGCEMPPGDFHAYVRRRRHELRNALTKVDGFCQLLELREQVERFGALLGDLQKIREFCREFDYKLFHIDSPVANAMAAVPAASVRHVSKSHSTKPGKLLIVDDSPSYREVLRRLLKPHGHQVEEAENGAQALEKMAATAFDVVLLDTLMPEFDGFQVLQHLKSQPDMPQSFVIVISGLEDINSAIRCIELGAEDYLTKPIDHLLLHARVNACLQKRQLHLRELEQFFPPTVAQELLHKPRLLHEGREAQVSVLFCDIRGFSKISEDQKLGTGKMIEWLSEVMDVLAECVLGSNGVVVDFQGDEILAMWGAPDEQSNHAELACGVALEMLAKVQELSRKWQPVIGVATEVGIGINSGPARVGNTGTRRRLKYGPLGNTVNLGSRVQGATKYFRTNLLISHTTKQLLDERFAMRRLATVKVVNIDTPVDLYEVVPSGLPRWTKRKETYEKVLHLFESRKLDEAYKSVGTLTKIGHLGPEFRLISRINECVNDPCKWSREWVLPGK